ncbi:hypothetical protein QR685DRAFT_449597, partial [Neurospora intermedia]
FPLWLSLACILDYEQTRYFRSYANLRFIHHTFSMCSIQGVRGFRRLSKAWGKHGSNGLTLGMPSVPGTAVQLTYQLTMPKL